MKVFYSPYSLKIKQSFSGLYKSTEGFLLKFVYENLEDRYSLYHPIESLSDLSLNKFLIKTRLRDDLLDRIEKLTLSREERFFGEVSSYYSAFEAESLIINAESIYQKGFKTVKLKAAKLSDLDFRVLKSLPFDYILDFNGREDEQAFLNLFQDLRIFLKERVKYIEDPCKTVANFDFPLASDFIDYGELADFKVIKPSGFFHGKSFIGLSSDNLVVTSYLDHPVGQLLSGKWAKEHDVKNECGLWTHTLFDQNSYSENFNKSGVVDLSIKDKFIDLLEKENWKSL